MAPKGNVTQAGLSREALKEILLGEAGLKDLVQATLQEVLEAQMDEALGAGKSERTQARLGYRSGHYERGLVTRVGKVTLRVPQDRKGLFSTEVFERYQRSEKALVASLTEMYVQGVSTRKVKQITEDLCGHEFSASSISRIVAKLDEELTQWATRPLHEETYPYLILDARYEKVREDGAVRSRAVLIAVGVNTQGRRRVLGVELAPRESETSWKEFLLGLMERGLRGVQFVVSDDHAGLRAAIEQVVSQALWQRCSVHFLRNAKDRFPRTGDAECLTELRWLYQRRSLEEARRDLRAWLSKWQDRYAKLCAWVEDNIDSTLSFYCLPAAHHKKMKSTNMLERLNEEIRRRTRVVRIFPNAQSCLRLVRALTSETDDEWVQGVHYLKTQELAETQKEPDRQCAAAAAA